MSAVSWDGIPLVKKYSPVPVPITREEYDETLGCLPPMNWTKGGGVECFQLCELAYDNITLTCVWNYKRNTGWKFYAPVNLPAPTILAKVQS